MKADLDARYPPPSGPGQSSNTCHKCAKDMKPCPALENSKRSRHIQMFHDVHPHPPPAYRAGSIPRPMLLDDTDQMQMSPVLQTDLHFIWCLSTKVVAHIKSKAAHLQRWMSANMLQQEACVFSGYDPYLMVVCCLYSKV